jgi:predicted DNA-binding protein (MmcQ/YjbR family)
MAAAKTRRSPARADARSPRNPDEAALRELGLGFPETTEDFPWGHRALKVKGKAFVFMGTGEEAGASDDRFFISCKLPESAPMALTLPGVAPTGYGLGRAGWVSASFPAGEAPVAMLKEWLRESYCAVAPRKLAALVAEGARGGATTGRATTGRATTGRATTGRATAKRAKPSTRSKAPKKTAARAKGRPRSA